MGNAALCRCGVDDHAFLSAPSPRPALSTFVVNNPLIKGKAGLDTLQTVLEFGCRAIELTTHSAKPGWLSKIGNNQAEPVVFHNGYGQNPITLRSCLNTIRQYAFVSSPYPLILCLDDHCTSAGKIKLAELLQSILGDHLHVPSDPRRYRFESPDSLQGKILVFYHDRLRARRFYSDCPDELKQLCYIVATDFKLLYASRFSTCAAGSVFADDVINKGKADGSSTMQEHTYRHMVWRCHADAALPGCNPCGQAGYEQGVQLEGLQWHLWDEQVWLAHGRFATDNGGCGYLLKPRVLRQENIPTHVWTKQRHAGHNRDNEGQPLTKEQSRSTPSMSVDASSPARIRDDETPILARAHTSPAPTSPLSVLTRRLAGLPDIPSATNSTLHLTLRLRSARLPQLPAVSCQTYVSIKLIDYGQAEHCVRSEVVETTPGRCRFSDAFELEVCHRETALLLVRVQLVLPSAGALHSNTCMPAPSRTSTSVDPADQPYEITYGHFCLSLNTLATGPCLVPLLNERCLPLSEACLGVDVAFRQVDDETHQLHVVSPTLAANTSPSSAWLASHPPSLPTSPCVQVSDHDHPGQKEAKDPASGHTPEALHTPSLPAATDMTPAGVALVQPAPKPSSSGCLAPPQPSRVRSHSSPSRPTTNTLRNSSDASPTSPRRHGSASGRVHPTRSLRDPIPATGRLTSPASPSRASTVTQASRAVSPTPPMGSAVSRSSAMAMLRAHAPPALPDWDAISM